MRISGVLNAAGTSVITVRGREATGTLRITRDGVVTGRLGGTRVALRPVSAARAGRTGDALSRQIRQALHRTTLGAARCPSPSQTRGGVRGCGRPPGERKCLI